MTNSKTTPSAPVRPVAESDAARASEGKASDKPPKKKMRMSFDDTVTIVVGPEKRKFIVPKNFLCRSSPFFRAALSGNWSETSPGGCLEMPEEDGDTFTAYLQWTFSGEVVVYEYEADLSNLNNHCPKLFDLYVFADKVGDGTAEYYHGPSSPYQRTICHATFGTYDSESDEPTAGELHAHEMAS